ncbi:MAG: PadR family transcriptional regulator [Firmicutes bacterium]|nr:PadR family transcriptional regulator [Bacillota bacterium]
MTSTKNCITCRCPRRVHRFIEPCLLLSLRRRPSYGYQLLEDLRDFGFNAEPDTAALYRNLRRMEEEGYVTSEWHPGEAGPAKRYYKITPLGCRLLAEWADAMEVQKHALGQFVEAYKQEFK